MPIAKTVRHTEWGTLVIFSQTSAGNTAQTVSTDGAQPYRVLFATVRYSAAPTQTGVVVTLNSAIAAAYDTALETGAANTQDHFFQPTTDLDIHSDDVLDVLAPAAGGAITSAATIYCLTRRD